MSPKIIMEVPKIIPDFIRQIGWIQLDIEIQLHIRCNSLNFKR